MLVDMKNWLIKKLGGFTKDEYTKLYLNLTQHKKDQYKKDLCQIIEHARIEKLYVHVTGWQQDGRSMDDIKKALAQELAKEIKDRIQIECRTNFDHYDYIGQLEVIRRY